MGASRRSPPDHRRRGHDRCQRRWCHDHRHQAFGGPVTLIAEATFTSTDDGNLTFDEDVNGPLALNVSSLGVTSFLGAVSVATLTTAFFGSTQIDGSGITTTGTLNLNNNVTIGSQATVNGEGGTTFGGTITQNQRPTVDQQRGILLGDDRGQPQHDHARPRERAVPVTVVVSGNVNPLTVIGGEGQYHLRPGRNPTGCRDIRGRPGREPEHIPGRSQQ